MVVMLKPARTDGGKRLIEMVSTRKRKLPLISVITVIYNGAAQLRTTIESVLQEKHSNIEYIVVDDGSTDGKCDVLLRQQPAGLLG
jgi:cellulose synthase/poly-beta-1,6-N-acetylglucosamine synthase-like glycosyltransferase